MTHEDDLGVFGVNDWHSEEPQSTAQIMHKAVSDIEGDWDAEMVVIVPQPEDVDQLLASTPGMYCLNVRGKTLDDTEFDLMFNLGQVQHLRRTSLGVELRYIVDNLRTLQAGGGLTDDVDVDDLIGKVKNLDKTVNNGLLEATAHSVAMLIEIMVAEQQLRFGGDGV